MRNLKLLYNKAVQGYLKEYGYLVEEFSEEKYLVNHTEDLLADMDM